MLANRLNHGDCIGVVGVSNSLSEGEENQHALFHKAEKFLQAKGFKIKKAENVFEDFYGSTGTREQKAKEFMKMIK